MFWKMLALTILLPISLALVAFETVISMRDGPFQNSRRKEIFQAFQPIGKAPSGNA